MFEVIAHFCSSQKAENWIPEKELNQMRTVTGSYDKKINWMKQDLYDYIKKPNDKTKQCAALSGEGSENLSGSEQQELVGIVKYQMSVAMETNVE